MIGYLRGKLTYTSPEYIIVDVNGVGYRVFIPLSTYYQLEDLDSDIMVYTYTKVREDAFLLYGFISEEELELFKLLVGVTNVGPKAALNVMSQVSVEEFKVAVADGNLTILTKISGVGPKMAERLVLELKDKIALIHVAGEKDKTAEFTKEESLVNNAISALIALGYRSAQAKKAVNQAWANLEEKDIETLIKTALRLVR
jgi:Holliday junction DNA helicase RuvA